MRVILKVAGKTLDIEADEVSVIDDGREVVTCGYCSQKGHNMRSCNVRKTDEEREGNHVV